MKLITKEIEKNAPSLYSQEANSASDVMVVAKFFNPYGSATWWMTEYDPEQRLAFGWCDLGMGCPELGYFSIAELEQVRIAPFGGKIERDMHYTPQTLREVMEQ